MKNNILTKHQSGKKQNNCIRKKKKGKRKYTLEKLLAEVKPKNLYGEIDFGPPVGKEKFWE